MSTSATGSRKAYPVIANASPLYLQIVALELGQVLEVAPSQLPPSYKSIRTFVGNISKRYKQYYDIKMLLNPIGWQICRVENLEIVKDLRIFKSKSKKMENTNSTRVFNMSDPALAQKVDEVINSATEDLILLTPRGVTPARLAALATANSAFKQIDDDVQMQGDIGIAVDIRQQAYVLLTDQIGNIRTMAQNVFGDTSTNYARMGFEGMISANDKDLVHLADRVNREAIKVAAQLQPEGWDAAFATDFKAAIVDFDAKRDTVTDAEHNRTEATRIRIAAGNSLYTELEKICNTGKDVFRMINPAKHDRFVIYDTPSGSPTPTPTIVNFTIPMGGYTVLLNLPYNGDLQFEVKNNSAASCKLFLSQDGLTPFGITIPVPPNSTLVKKYSDLSASGSYLILANEDMMLSVNGVFTYPV